MNKLFAIVAHQPSHALYWTVEYLSAFPENTILIHYDAKSDISEIADLAKENVILLTKRVPVYWGDVSQIHATCRLLEEAMRYRFDYFFLLSGDDVPAASNEAINAFLSKHRGQEFIHYQDERSHYVNPADRVMYKYPPYFFTKQKSLVYAVKRKLFKHIRFMYKNHEITSLLSNELEMTFYKGTNWFALTYGSIGFILDTLHTHPTLLPSFNFTYCSDEIFFHTLLKMKPEVKIYDNPGVRNNCFRYIDWNSGPDYPRTLDVSDVEKIRKNFYFFTRKVSDKLTQEEFSHFKDLVN